MREILLMKYVKYTLSICSLILIFYESYFVSYPNYNILMTGFMIAGFCYAASYYKSYSIDNLQGIKNKYINGEIDISTLENLAENQILSERI